MADLVGPYHRRPAEGRCDHRAPRPAGQSCRSATCSARRISFAGEPVPPQRELVPAAVAPASPAAAARAARSLGRLAHRVHTASPCSPPAPPRSASERGWTHAGHRGLGRTYIPPEQQVLHDLGVVVHQAVELRCHRARAPPGRPRGRPASAVTAARTAQRPIAVLHLALLHQICLPSVHLLGYDYAGSVVSSSSGGRLARCGWLG